MPNARSTWRVPTGICRGIEELAAGSCQPGKKRAPFGARFSFTDLWLNQNESSIRLPAVHPRVPVPARKYMGSWVRLMFSG